MPILAVVPVAVGETGNLTLEFLALSYAGTLTVTVVADADADADLPDLAAALQRELDAVVTERAQRCSRPPTRPVRDRRPWWRPAAAAQAGRQAGAAPQHPADAAPV